MSIYYLPQERQFYLAPDTSLHYHIYEEEENGYYTPLKVSEHEKAAEIVANSLEEFKGLDRAIVEYKSIMETIVRE
ncbi:MAG: hypothetical protein KatS3mg101_1134 [Patescibacteria group bacterium]|nr:MAG: hypothetical protein KatS3mg101_1134 [Patescibacteria group bacterium]